ncbi:uncharacterized protein [Argopecten irradians]|uniref:uncharacterized protein n=1 Tax=Argopecten irradians TaxID=31199 RepID=UPI0037172B45
MSKSSSEKTQLEIDRTDARDDIIACMQPGKYASMGIFVATLGTVYAAQQIYMYNTKKFLKYKNRFFLPFGTALVVSYSYFISVFIRCRNEVIKDYPQLIKDKATIKKPSQKSTEFDDDV